MEEEGNFILAVFGYLAYTDNICYMDKKISEKNCRFHRFYLSLHSSMSRGVAQLVSVRVWGACGRQFESAHPDYEKKKKQEIRLRLCKLYTCSSIGSCHFRGDSDKCLAVSQRKTRWW